MVLNSVDVDVEIVLCGDAKLDHIAKGVGVEDGMRAAGVRGTGPVRERVGLTVAKI